MRIVIFTTLLIFLGSGFIQLQTIYAQSLNLQITQQSNVLSTKNILKINLDPTTQGLKIRPICKNCVAHIFYEDRAVWIGQNAAWSQLPPVKNTMQLKLAGLAKKTQLSFDIQDTQTAKVYKTQNLQIWANKNQNYLDKLNKNLNTTQIDTNIKQPIQKPAQKQKNIVNSTKVYPKNLTIQHGIFYLTVFLVSVAMGITWNKVVKFAYAKI